MRTRKPRFLYKAGSRIDISAGADRNEQVAIGQRRWDADPFDTAFRRTKRRRAAYVRPSRNAGIARPLTYHWASRSAFHKPCRGPWPVRHAYGSASSNRRVRAGRRCSASPAGNCSRTHAPDWQAPDVPRSVARRPVRAAANCRSPGPWPDFAQNLLAWRLRESRPSTKCHPCRGMYRHPIRRKCRHR